MESIVPDYVIKIILYLHCFVAMPLNIATAQPITCTSRFHESDRNHCVSRNRFQYVCSACRTRWADQIQNAEQDDQDLIREGLEAARILIQLENDGRSLFGDSSSVKRKLDGAEESPKECKRRKVEDNTQLPPEILSTVWSRCLDSTPRCALDLLVPDWKVCNREDPIHEKLLETAQVATYTRGTDAAVSTFSTTFGHDDGDHIFLPMKSLDEGLLVVNTSCRNETVRSFFQEGTQVFQLAKNNLPTSVAGESFITDWRDAFPLRGEQLRNILPFDDEQPGEKRKTPNGPPHLFKLLRHVIINSPLSLVNVDARSMVGSGANIGEANLEALNKAIDLDRTSHLWLSWSQMPLLESVLLDLRIYSHDLNTDRGCVSKTEITQRAGEMGRWLRLKLLVIAGLQSYCFTTSYKSYTAEQIEGDDEVDGEPNWVKVFMPAVRPGGRLVFVDRQMDPVGYTKNHGYDVDMDVDL
ncbi:hypothetical protein F4820DRAFT_413539 [Hypoxylon rubiginosum]|uniref:Uncharacterized protein n=1 Tax=Hypoxylon rubiginosum TaxID=110542 RepID=A0ACB9Z7E0_9PEZI|nr:hypothetical protein F4820DRAFT_413539 [Hypoxylon rubiginosum]